MAFHEVLVKKGTDAYGPFVADCELTAWIDNVLKNWRYNILK